MFFWHCPISDPALVRILSVTAMWHGDSCMTVHSAVWQHDSQLQQRGEGHDKCVIVRCGLGQLSLDPQNKIPGKKENNLQKINWKTMHLGGHLNLIWWDKNVCASELFCIFDKHLNKHQTNSPHHILKIMEEDSLDTEVGDFLQNYLQLRGEVK